MRIRHLIAAGCLLVTLLAAAAPAQAEVALATATFEPPGPIIAGDRIVWAERGALKSAPLSGAPATTLPAIVPPQGSRLEARELAGSQQRLVARSILAEGPELRNALYAASPGGPFAPLADPIGFSPAVGRALAVVGEDVLTLEQSRPVSDYSRARLVSRSPGAAPVTLPLPDRADLAAFAVAGDLIAVAIASGPPRDHQDDIAIALLDRHTGQELRRIAIPPKLRDQLEALAVSADGTVAFPADDFIGWAPPGAASFTPLRPSLEPESDEIAVAKGRIAFVSSGGIGGRVTVVAAPAAQPPAGTQAPRPPVLFSGTPTARVEGLDFDGDNVAWQSSECDLVSPVPAPATLRIPPGPCFRAEIVPLYLIPPRIPRRHPAYPLRVRCMTAAGTACRMGVYVKVGRRRFGPDRLSVPIGHSRVARVPLPARVADRLRAAYARERNPEDIVIRLSDGAGRRKLLVNP